MNENLNLVEVLNDCHKGTKLYSPVFGDVEFNTIIGTDTIIVNTETDDTVFFSAYGKMYSQYNGECLLFPSREQLDWSKFNPHTNQTKFDPNTLNPFDKVLARNDSEDWSCVFFSHIAKDEETYPYACGYDWFTYCIPYNDDTKHLVGTSKEAPEFYRYWEE